MRSYFSMFGIGVPVWTILPLLIVIGGCGNRDDPNREPHFVQPNSISAIGVRDFYINQTFTFVAFATDPDGDTIYYRWKAMLNEKDVTDSVFRHVMDTDQRIQFTTSEKGKYSIEMTANDYNGGIVTDKFDIKVEEYKVRGERPKIILPKDMDEVSLDAEIWGAYYLIPENEWIVVYFCSNKTDELNQKIDKWNLSIVANVSVDGFWRTNIKIGGDTGTKFNIGVALRDTEDIKQDLIDKDNGKDIIPPVFDDMRTVVRK